MSDELIKKIDEQYEAYKQRFSQEPEVIRCSEDFFTRFKAELTLTPPDSKQVRFNAAWMRPDTALSGDELRFEGENA
jgi:hypothetical protein